MPRISLTETQRRDAYLAEAIVTIARRCGHTQKTLAGKAGISAATMTDRLRHPELFRLSELRRISNVLNVSLASLLEGRVAITRFAEPKEYA